MSEIPAGVILTVLVLAVVALVFSPALVGKLLSPEARVRIEWVAILVLAPALVFLSIWKGISSARSNDMWPAGGYWVYALFIGYVGASAVWRRLKAKPRETAS
ncbi:MAG TPA: hypothetical protein VIG84_03120 [Brevundimonas sp.]